MLTATESYVLGQNMNGHSRVTDEAYRVEAKADSGARR